MLLVQLTRSSRLQCSRAAAAAAVTDRDGGVVVRLPPLLQQLLLLLLLLRRRLLLLLLLFDRGGSAPVHLVGRSYNVSCCCVGVLVCRWLRGMKQKMRNNKDGTFQETADERVSVVVVRSRRG